MNIIGLGNPGCKIASLFEKYPQYNVYYCDIGRKGKNVVSLDKFNKIEEIDKIEIDFGALEGLSADETFFILAGSGKTSMATLRILENIKENENTVVYIRPSTALLNEEEKLLERSTYGVLQEYARSGMFKRIFLVDNIKIEEIVGETSLLEYFNTINKTIATTIHMLNYLMHASNIMGNLSATNEINRICTLGIFDIKAGKEQPFFELEQVKEKQIYYLLNNADLTENKNILKLINKHVEELKEGCESVSFAVVESSYEESYAYTISYTNVVQGFNYA
jgi:hypothetical protein